MTAKQRETIEKILKPNQVAVDTRTQVNGNNKDGFPHFETVFIEPPLNYKLVKLIEPYNGAVLEDLDYVEPTA